MNCEDAAAMVGGEGGACLAMLTQDIPSSLACTPFPAVAKLNPQTKVVWSRERLTRSPLRGHLILTARVVLRVPITATL